VSEPEGRWMRVDFWGYLPEGADLFPGDHLDATGRLAELFGFTALAHLTVRDKETFPILGGTPGSREDEG